MHTMDEHQEQRKITRQSTKGRNKNEPVQAMLHILINRLRREWVKSNEYQIKIKTWLQISHRETETGAN